MDGTLAYDWSPPNVNRNNTMLTAGLRFNEPLPVNFHNTMSLGYVRNNLSPQFLPPGMPAWKTEQGVEFNTLLDPYRCSFCSRSFSITRTWEGGCSARSFSDSEQRSNSRKDAGAIRNSK